MVRDHLGAAPVTRYVEPTGCNPDINAHVAPNPCPSCPYRADVPAGIWEESEYAKLHDYDADTGDQPYYAFGCHRDDGRLCAGWLGHRRPMDLLAVRIGVIGGTLPPEITGYTTDVPLFTTGAEAAAHGMSGIEAPGPDAQAAAQKIIKLRQARRRD
jgi:hypothetical protein